MSSQNGKNKRVRSGPKAKQHPRSKSHNQVENRRAFLQKKRSNPGSDSRVPPSGLSARPLSSTPFPSPSLFSSRRGPTRPSSFSQSRPSSSSLRSPLFPDVTDAPAAVSSSNTMRRFRVEGDFYDGVRIHTCTPLYELQDAITSVGATKSIGCLTMVAWSDPGTVSTITNQIHTTTLGPMFNYSVKNASTTGSVKTQLMTHGMNTQLLYMAYGFTQYRRKRAILHYQPSASTGTDRACILAYSADPCNNIVGITSHFVTSSMENQISGPLAVTSPDNASLETGSNVVSFGAWNAWSLELPGDKNKVYNIAPLPVYTGITLNGAYNMADIRDTQWGAITCIMNSGNGSGARIGRLWIEVEYEFLDPCASGTATTQLQGIPHPDGFDRPNRFLPIDHKFREGKEEEKPSSDDQDYDQPEVISPPRYVPLSVSVPGSGSYLPSSTPSSQSSSSSVTRKSSNK